MLKFLSEKFNIMNCLASIENNSVICFYSISNVVGNEPC